MSGIFWRCASLRFWGGWPPGQQGDYGKKLSQIWPEVRYGEMTLALLHCYGCIKLTDLIWRLDDNLVLTSMIGLRQLCGVIGKYIHMNPHSIRNRIPTSCSGVKLAMYGHMMYACIQVRHQRDVPGHSDLRNCRSPVDRSLPTQGRTHRVCSIHTSRF